MLRLVNCRVQNDMESMKADYADADEKRKRYDYND